MVGVDCSESEEKFINLWRKKKRFVSECSSNIAVQNQVPTKKPSFEGKPHS